MNDHFAYNKALAEQKVEEARMAAEKAATPEKYQGVMHVLRYSNPHNALNYFNASSGMYFRPSDIQDGETGELIGKEKNRRMALAKEYAESVGKELRGYPPSLR